MKSNAEAVCTTILKIAMRRWRVALWKAVAWSAVLLGALILTANGMKDFGPTETPLPFFIAACILGLVPFVYFKVFRVFLSPSFEGMVIACANKNTSCPRPGSIRGIIAKDACFVNIRPDRGRVRTFIYPQGSLMAYALSHLQVGQRARYVSGSKYPFAIDNLDGRPFCPMCGQFGAENEDICTCGSLYLKKLSDDAAEQ